MEKKKYCLVTGATGGLGSAFARKLVKENKNLIITGTKQEKLDAIKAELESINGNVCVETFECDLSSEQSRKKFFDYILEQKFELEMLVNNAGYITEGAVAEVSKDSLMSAIRVNCEGTVDLTKFVVDNHTDGEKLNILTVASLAGFYPMPYMAIYAATKSFLLSFMTALRVEVKNKNIIVSTVVPSGIYTTKAMKDAIASQGVGGKLSSMSPEKIASIALCGAKKGKSIIIPGCFNKFTKFISNFVTYNGLARVVGKRWRKSQKKRNMVK